jgi:hypothetical protein
MKKKSMAREVDTFIDKTVRPVDDTMMRNDPTTILVRNDFYETLDFRINSLRSEYADLIHDIVEQGSSAFALKVAQMANPKCMYLSPT